MAWRTALEGPTRRLARPPSSTDNAAASVAWGAAPPWAVAPASTVAPPPPSADARGELRYEFSLTPGPDFDTDTQCPDAAPPADDQLQPASENISSGNAASSSGNDRDADTATGSASGSGSAGARPGPSEASTASTTARPAGAELKVARGIAKTRGGGVARPPARGNLSHTKLCRDRLNGMFERLRTTLPAAPVGVEVKHKAQVLDYAITVLKSMVRRTSELEIELAVSSNRATMEWISNLVASVPSFPEAATEVMRVFSKRRHWRQAELWLTQRTEKRDIRLVFGAALSNDAMGPSTPTGESIADFSDLSRAFTFAPDEGVQGRVWSSMRPEWLAGLNNAKTFARAALALRFGIKTCLAVPITITGKIEAVMCFYDTKHRPYDSQCVDLAMRLTWALGNATGGKRAGEAES